MNKYNFRLYIDFRDLALPLHIELNRHWFSFHVLAFDFTWLKIEEEVEQTPEQELEILNEYCNQQMTMIAEERAEILARMGISTSG